MICARRSRLVRGYARQRGRAGVATVQRPVARPLDPPRVGPADAAGALARRRRRAVRHRRRHRAHGAVEDGRRRRADGRRRRLPPRRAPARPQGGAGHRPPSGVRRLGRDVVARRRHDAAPIDGRAAGVPHRHGQPADGRAPTGHVDASRQPRGTDRDPVARRRPRRARRRGPGAAGRPAVAAHRLGAAGGRVGRPHRGGRTGRCPPATAWPRRSRWPPRSSACCAASRSSRRRSHRNRGRPTPSAPATARSTAPSAGPWPTPCAGRVRDAGRPARYSSISRGRCGGGRGPRTWRSSRCRRGWRRGRPSRRRPSPPGPRPTRGRPSSWRNAASAGRW